MPHMHLAQINIGRMKAPLEDPSMAGFMTNLDRINALAERSPGFIWRLQTAAGNATDVRPFEDERIIINMSVWASIETLRTYIYGTAHAEFLRRRREWFERFDRAFLALWWIPVGHVPSIDEAKERLALIEAHGPTPAAFTFTAMFPPEALSNSG
jgi:uncharacterized protein DUF3291